MAGPRCDVVWVGVKREDNFQTSSETEANRISLQSAYGVREKGRREIQGFEPK